MYTVIIPWVLIGYGAWWYLNKYEPKTKKAQREYENNIKVLKENNLL